MTVASSLWLHAGRRETKALLRRAARAAAPETLAVLVESRRRYYADPVCGVRHMCVAAIGRAALRERAKATDVSADLAGAA